VAFVAGAYVFERLVRVLGQAVSDVAESVGESVGGAIHVGVAGPVSDDPDPDPMEFGLAPDDDGPGPLFDPTYAFIPDPGDDRIISITPGDSLIPR